MKVEYGISFISILNFFKNISQVLDNFSKIGYSVFQALPLRKVNGKERNIICFEDVWRPDLHNIFQVQKGKIFYDLLSLYLFKQGSKRDEILQLYKWRKLQQIKHNWGDMGDYVEISNQISAKNIKYIEKMAVAMNTYLVPDIKHLKEFMQEHNITIEEITKQLGYLFAPIIHFQPICSVKEFIEKKDIDNSEEIHIFNALLYAILENFHNGIYKTDKLIIIVEYNPAFLIFSEKKSLETAKKMLDIIKKYL